MKKVRFIPLFAALYVFVCGIFAYAEDIPQPTDRFFINDYADVIDSDTEDYIFERGKEYSNNGGPQVVVLTMETIDGDSVEEFSIECAREWGIGEKDENNGVLILLVMDTRDIRIEVGYGLEGVLNDGKCGRFIRGATDLLSSGDYSGGIKQIYDDIIGELEEPTEDDEDELTTSDMVICGVVLLLVILLIIWSNIGNGRRGGRGGRRFYSSGGFGGSSGGFSGGGGSFGGGGASGKF